MADSLNSAILKKLVSNNLGTNEQVVRVRISQVRKKYPGITLNAAAQVLADSRGFSVMGRLDKEDRQSLSFVRTVSTQTNLSSSRRPTRRPSFRIFLRYQTVNPFQKRHIEEVNIAYNSKCYTAVFILCRKIIENLIIDLLIKQFPQNKRQNKELYFDIGKRRFHDFSVILDNLHNNGNEFPPSVFKAIERLIQKTRPFARDANDKTHSWFHIATKSELDNIGIKEIIDLIIQIDTAIKN